jgi:hypothetical protein
MRSAVGVENDRRKVPFASVVGDLVSRNSGSSQAENRTEDKQTNLGILQIKLQDEFGLHSERACSAIRTRSGHAC